MKYLVTTFVAASILLSCDSENEVSVSEYETLVDVKIQVGSIVYSDIECVLDVTAYNGAQDVKWTSSFNYDNKDNSAISIPSGYDHYKISLNKWGVTDEIIISANELKDHRANGPDPKRYLLGGHVAAKRLKYTIKSMDNGNEGVRPLVKTEYIWKNDLLTTITNSEYIHEQDAFNPTSRYDVTYKDNVVYLVTGYAVNQNTKSIETIYEYYDNRQLKSISETSFTGGVNHFVSITYDETNNTGTAVYSHSIGNGYTYKFKYAYGNIVESSLAAFGTKCNEGTFKYDKNINPYRHLGFVHSGLIYISVNNKLEEDVAWTGCAFPDTVIEKIEYEYDDEGYPLKRTLTWSNGKREYEEYGY